MSHIPVSQLKGVGPARAAALARLGIETVADLLGHFPRRHEDRSRLTPVHLLQEGEWETVQGIVTGVREQRPRRGLTITKVGITDGLAVAWGVWFNRAYLGRQFRPGAKALLSGRVERRNGQVQLQNPEYELLDGQDALHTGRIVPVYALTEGLTPRWLRQTVKTALDEHGHRLAEVLPAALRQRHGLIGRQEAYRAIHFPDSAEALAEARRRLVFDELFLLQLALAVLKSAQTDDELGVSHAPHGRHTQALLAALPFQLTAAQQRVWQEIGRDMERDRPMHRLLQGDVGSGKTVVAALALAKAADSGRQGALMAPTEILAEQHYRTLRQLLGAAGLQVALLTGSQPKAARERALAALASGEAQVVVGTHALIQAGVRFAGLSLVITDEQHRFGVRQRATLQDKAAGPGGGARPDTLVMTATPIPRTLTLTLYGDLDVSVIDELPPGRQPVRTHWITPDMRHRAYRLIAQEVAKGRQAYVVCPLVAESENLQAEAAVDLHARLQREVFPDLFVGLLHGRMPPTEKDQATQAFRAGALHVLVATTVVEVGVDVPNATVMVIEDADRFGLAQLHQLRGRVGRGAEQAWCVLIADPRSDESRERLRVLERTSDGFQIAEEDLRLRGTGEFFGTRQHGLTDLKIASPLHDLPMLEQARAEALAVVAADPRLRLPEHAFLRTALLDRFRDNLGMILVG